MWERALPATASPLWERALPATVARRARSHKKSKLSCMIL
jgi:hypothetical protein